MIYLKTSRSLAQRKTNETKLLGSTPGGRWGTRLGLEGGRGEGNGLAAASAGSFRDAVDSGDLGSSGSGDLGIWGVRRDFCRKLFAPDLP